ncbi:DUF3224 domain-containing protein [Sphingomonas sp. ac-8]|uniref:DUF3224 domain-containing protein n=1 Tax=Sphingomonas sp. ac-8 TaxID=3242977 RepID=UPI003A800450
MTETEARGAFDVTVTPASGADAPTARMTLAKTFHGPLEATGAGEMLAVQTDTPGSAGYVAMERVTGTLDGRDGSFVLQHSGTMDRGAPTLSVTVVPDSGTGQLSGITGTMAIDIRDGKHFYTFRYRLPK